MLDDLRNDPRIHSTLLPAEPSGIARQRQRRHAA
jgi:hypothetical protein